MCGISGVIDPQSSYGLRAETVNRMCAAMQHRGPDDAGVESWGPATLGMRRLAIFDPDNGRQPMSTADGRFHLVFNGAIYNHRELREELSNADVSFRTRCDTEVLLEAFARWGEACVTRLRGMFAFAIWDEREQALTLARDPFGIKPLYFHRAGQRLVFASEVSALLAGGVAPQIDAEAVAEFLAWFAVPAPRTIYRGVTSLLPGELARFKNGEFTTKRMWRFPAATAERAARSQAEFTAELRARLEDSISAHTLADVPVGAFLSGGLDSSAVVGLMSRRSGQKLKTFSIGFEEAAFSEQKEAEESARHFGTEHTTRIITGREVAADLPKILGSLDQPTGDGINTYYVSETARRGGVTVALSGLGGDELFGGYPSFQDIPRLERWLPLWNALPGFARAPLLSRLRSGGARHRKLADLLAHARNRDELAALYRTVMPHSTLLSLLSGDAQQAVASASPFHRALPELRGALAGRTTRETISAWELRTYMADLLLRDSDVMSMRHSLELRVPFVDRPLIEWLSAQPARFRYTPKQPKRALADAIADLLPPAMHTRRKRGFTFPFGEWLRTELRPFLEETFSAASVGRSGLFSPAVVGTLWSDYVNGRDSRQWSRVWGVAVLIDFVNRQGTKENAR